MSKYKLGSTIDIILECEDDAEWDKIYPYELALCEAKISKSTYQFTTTVDEASRSILFSANSANWRVGDAQADIKIVKDGRAIYVPAGDAYIEFSTVAPIANEVE